MPFWKGDQPGRPAELGRAIGARLRALSRQEEPEAAGDLRAGGLDERAARNLVAYLREQREATRHLPDDRTVVVERFRDELGDWRLVVHSVLGARVNGAWALAIGARLRERYGVDAQVVPADDGIVVRLPDLLDARAWTPRPPPTWSCSSPTRSRPSWRRRSAGRRCSPRGSGSARPGRCCCPAAIPAAASRCGSSGSGPPNCSTWPASSPTSPSPWKRPASACRTSSTCPAW